MLTLFKVLCRRHPGCLQPGQLRTLQRRVRDWRAQYGPDREVYLEQVAVPGREAAFDFTDASRRCWLSPSRRSRALGYRTTRTPADGRSQGHRALLRLGRINRVDHNYSLSITVPVGLDGIASAASQTRWFLASGNWAAISCGDVVVGEESVEQSEALLRLLKLEEVAGIGHKGVFDTERLAE